MANDKYIFKLEDLDDWLSSTGFLFPMNNIQMERFDKLYENFDFKLKNARIDVEAILNGNLKKKTIIKFEDINTNLDMSEYKMVARKGIEDLPKDIVDKMYNKHRKKSNDKE
ncbi:hypothetical protein [Flavobacterium mekongense]|uniref:hypothetical protein n=1 Tax=Flavobacterium mekongense TaxID=3379707 RepID=UPI00399BD537